MKVAVLQSNYLPWKGYFDLIASVDLFVFYDCVQFTKNDWRNRNKIKTQQGLQWISVPAGSDIKRRVCDVEINSLTWRAEHWKTLQHNYRQAPFFKLSAPWFEAFYAQAGPAKLSDINQGLIRGICQQFLGIGTQFADSRDYTLCGTKLERLLDLLQQVGASSYLSGPSARDYIDSQAFADRGIGLSYVDYRYPIYAQFHPPFEHGVSIVDLLWHTGPQAPHFIRRIPK